MVFSQKNKISPNRCFDDSPKGAHSGYVVFDDGFELPTYPAVSDFYNSKIV
jgi:hypothetical protein